MCAFQAQRLGEGHLLELPESSDLQLHMQMCEAPDLTGWSRRSEEKAMQGPPSAPACTTYTQSRLAYCLIFLFALGTGLIGNSSLTLRDY